LLAQAEANVRGDRHVREQGVGLEHRVDRAAVRRQGGQVGAVQEDVSGGWADEAGDGVQQGGLSGSGTTEQDEKFVASDGEVEVFEGRDGAVGDGQGGDRQGVFGSGRRQV
jgi:hypothetical protein